jgi:hypothetical protein
MSTLYSFVRESNRIEGILRKPSDAEINVHESFLGLPKVAVRDMERFVETVAGAGLRKRLGMDVRVGRHVPPPGGPNVAVGLREILWLPGIEGRAPWDTHVMYEHLHPFMDGNGRSGRALWAWMRLREDRDPFALGFLHSAYYEALEADRGEQ